MKKLVALVLAMLLAMTTIALMPAATAEKITVDKPVYAICTVPENYISGIVRSEPNFSAEIVTYIPRDDFVLVTAFAENWFTVDTLTGKTGYMHKSLLTLTDKVPEEVPEEIIFPAPAAVIVSNQYGTGILRNAPSFEDSRVLAYLKNGTPVTVTALDGHWYSVETEDGKSGFMHDSVLTLIDVNDPDNTITLNKAANMREEPDSESLYLHGMDKGMTALLIERGTEWSFILFAGDVGYIHNSVYDYNQ